ncbi:hypothetical protein C4565_00725 [Candidatus Parcubacteria bacterium]|nr:MAG: hypothetical protein C4565_00725 [Candidatus Parcubacteria bacterium]
MAQIKQQKPVSPSPTYEVQCFRAFPPVLDKDTKEKIGVRPIVCRRLLIGSVMFRCTFQKVVLKGGVCIREPRFSDSRDEVKVPTAVNKWPDLHLAPPPPKFKIRKGKTYSLDQILPEVARLLKSDLTARKALNEVITSEPS